MNLRNTKNVVTQHWFPISAALLVAVIFIAAICVGFTVTGHIAVPSSRNTGAQIVAPEPIELTDDSTHMAETAISVHTLAQDAIYRKTGEWEPTAITDKSAVSLLDSTVKISKNHPSFFLDAPIPPSKAIVIMAGDTKGSVILCTGSTATPIMTSRGEIAKVNNRTATMVGLVKNPKDGEWLVSSTAPYPVAICTARL